VQLDPQPRHARDLRLTTAYLTSAFCSVAAALYGLADIVEPSPWVQYVVGAAPLIAVILWAHRDAERSGLPIVHDWDYFLVLTFPFLLSWHVFRMRGRRGWRLLAKLLLIAFAPWLTAIVVAATRYAAVIK
jgi:hypothetical protein